MRISFEEVVKFAVGSLLTAIFLYWSILAIIKYRSQPVSTELRYRFGDDNLGNISFPAFSLCPSSLSQLRQVMNCSNLTHEHISFTDIIDHCMETTNDSIEDLMLRAKSFWNGTQISFSIMPGILTSENGTRLFDEFWSWDISPRFGFCWTFDHTRVPDYSKLRMHFNKEHPYITLDLNGQNMKWLGVYLHSGHDFPDHMLIYPKVDIDSIGMFARISIKESKLEQVSTRDAQCGEFPFVTCASRKMYQQMYSEFGCETVYINNGTYLNDIRKFNQTVPMCNREVHEKVRKLVDDSFGKTENNVCKRACTQYMYLMQLQTFAHANQSTTVRLQFADINVAINTHTISYDYQSLIGEVGGTLGLFLGVSGISIVEAIMSCLQRFNVRS